MNKMMKQNSLFGCLLVSIAILFSFSIARETRADCVFFNGVDSYVEIPDSPELSGGPGKSITVEAWVYPMSYAGHVVTKNLNWNNKDWGLYISTEGLVGFQKETWSIEGCQVGNWVVLSSETIPTNKWSHIGFVFDDDNDVVNVYIDGVIKGSRPLANCYLPDTSAVVWIGGMGPFYYAQTGGALFHGYIDEVRVWDVARTEEEIFDNMYPGSIASTEVGLVAYYDFVEDANPNILYDRTANSNDGVLSGPTWQSPCPAGQLVAYYPFNGNANDESGNGNHGTVHGAALTTDRFANPDSAYSFDGVDDYIEVSNSPTLEISNSISLVAWVKIIDPGVPQIMIKREGTHFPPWFPGEAGFQFGLDGDDHPSFGTGATSLGGWSHATSTLEHGLWYLIVATYDNDTQKIFVNGEFVGSRSYPGQLGANSESLYIGVNPTDPTQSFDGTIDDIRIYNRALSEPEIQELYLEGASPVDSDGDGVPDDEDNCPNSPDGAPVDANGCSAQITLIDAKVRGGWGGSHRHFWVDDYKAIFKIDFEITGGPEGAQYKVIGIADSDYEYCNEKKAERAKKAGYFGPGLHTIKFRKRIPSCVFPPDWVTQDREWVPVKWKIKLKTEDGLTLLDKDKQRTSDTFCVHWAYAPSP
jgi:hypothetical protein